MPAKPLRQLNENRSEDDGGSNHAVHVKGLKLEHLRNAVPADNFSLGQGDAEQDADQNKSQHDDFELEDVRENEMGHGESTDEKTDHCNQRWQLEAAQPADGVA